VRAETPAQAKTVDQAALPSGNEPAKQPTPVPKVDPPPPAAAPAKAPPPKVVPAPSDELDFSGLIDDAPKPEKKPEPAPPAAAAAKPPSPTAELEKADPRHASARRFCRVAVSEIKLYKEADVAAGRAAKDLWKRLGNEINLCIQTYEKRVAEDVRAEFDYLYDELVRQLAEGDASKLGPDAPTSTSPKKPAKAP
jgi:hypothetical protein